MSKRFGLLILLIFSGQCLFAQRYLSLSAGPGNTLAHHEEINAIKGNPFIMRLDYAAKLQGRAYHERLGNPLSGLSLTFIDHGDPSTGRSYALSTFLQPTIISGKRHALSGRMSVGAAYIEKPFDEARNPLQFAIGSHLNFFVETHLVYEAKLSERWGMHLQGGILHLSNAAARQPNAGLNILTASVGTTYQLSSEGKPALAFLNRKDLITETKTWQHFLDVSIGMKTVNRLGDSLYRAIGASYNAQYRYGVLSSLLVGLDVDYNEGYIAERAYLNIQRGEGNEVPFKEVRWAMLLGHEFHLNRVSLVMQMGRYIVLPFNAHSRYFQRYGLRYYPSDKLYVSATLRTHAAKADYMEWSIGYRLFKKSKATQN
ncbi:acyloxyacyl hydrolase [Penaeicola halotolerans]|uniref:acyloxyacyl hydrolase n=1 Tax=Penaeicola halotolerans TaxID=2793196 RepID=UPI001CF88EAE|nr:acyloxyacyl hydrolase [Penaeicola halotolerans]